MNTDELARLSPEDREPFITQAAGEIGLAPALVEKDFWVCWLLQRLFSLDAIGSHLTFKGGTSLSKVFGLIDRFSEDIDLSIERDYLGFGGENSPEADGISKKERGRRIKCLNEACEKVCGGSLIDRVHDVIAKELGSSAADGLRLDASDPQTILWEYPRIAEGGPQGYVAPLVKVELGARSDHFPVEDAVVQADLVGALKGRVAAVPARIRVLAARRTFWEKATILHQLAHLPDDKTPRARMSRHYYDLHCMALSPFRVEALGDLGLLTRVAVHKSTYFSDNKARYELARPGTLRLIPPIHIKDALHRDFTAMESMFFKAPVPFGEIIETLQVLEEEINQLAEQ